jgi:hypothetical protein
MARKPAPIEQFAGVNYDDAQRFLSVLDERTQQFTFQLFDDNHARKDKRLALTLHGTLEQHFATLVDYSRRGAGVFVTINTTNFQGRYKECIVEVRGYFADLDGAPCENLGRLGLMPHAITETSHGHFHALYIIEDAPLSEVQFRRTQQSVATLFDSDPSVCDLPRVMRLPGFPHQKDPENPFVPRIVYQSDGSAPYTEVQFQRALTKAHERDTHVCVPAARKQRRFLLDDVEAGLPSGPPDWSKGYAEGQRNKQCAIRAGSCLARGMTEEEARAECLQWNKQNVPPLPEDEVCAIVASIARTAKRKQSGLVVVTETRPQCVIPEFIFDGDVPLEQPRMLIKKLLPTSGIAFVGGQSSAGKTFVAVSLGVALASGTDFFRHRVKERVGVLYIAAEGAANFGARVDAAKLAVGIKEPIAFAWTSNVPMFRTDQEVIAFVNKLRVFSQEMRQRFGIRLGAIIIDTVAACFSMQDENSNAEVSRVCAIMRRIGDGIGAVVVPIHHYGKDAATGLRGASAWRGAADVVISVTADIDPNTGRIGNRGLAVAKSRDAEQGPIAPFRLEWVKLGTDEDGEEFGTCVVRIDPERELPNITRGKVEKGVSTFETAARVALGELGEDVKIRRDSPKIRAVDLKHVRAKFCDLYVTGAADCEQAKAARERAWLRALNKKPDDYATAKGADGREWLWLNAIKPGG